MPHRRRSRMSPRSALVLAVFLTCTAAGAAADPSLEFGLLERSGDLLYLHSDRVDLAAGSQILRFDSPTALYVQQRLDGQAAKGSRVSVRSKPCAVYSLRGATAESFWFTTSPVVILPAGASSKLPPGLRSSTCTSTEGAHYSVWATRDSGEVRVWSAYQYLPYAVEPSCSKSEFAE